MARVTVKKKPARRAQSERREETMAAILDAAERLFAEHGRDGVTLRMLGTEAGVDAPLVHYYFGDLEGVFSAVFARKADIINAVRNQRMDEYVAAHGDGMTVEGAFDVFLRPVFETIASDSKYWANFAAIVAYATASRDHGREYMRVSFDVTVHRFIEMLMKLAPQVPRVEIYWFYHMLSGSQTVTLAQTGRIDVLSGGLCQSTELMSALEPMMQIYIAGFEALRARHAQPATARSGKTARTTAVKSKTKAASTTKTTASRAPRKRKS
jgi:AcrR family transcriptional regulator